jgi:hypothetical protein
MLRKRFHKSSRPVAGSTVPRRSTTPRATAVDLHRQCRPAVDHWSHRLACSSSPCRRSPPRSNGLQDHRAAHCVVRTWVAGLTAGAHFNVSIPDLKQNRLIWFRCWFGDTASVEHARLTRILSTFMRHRRCRRSASTLISVRLCVYRACPATGTMVGWLDRGLQCTARFSWWTWRDSGTGAATTFIGLRYARACIGCCGWRSARRGFPGIYATGKIAVMACLCWRPEFPKYVLSSHCRGRDQRGQRHLVTVGQVQDSQVRAGQPVAGHHHAAGDRHGRRRRLPSAQPRSPVPSGRVVRADSDGPRLTARRSRGAAIVVIATGPPTVAGGSDRSRHVRARDAPEKTGTTPQMPARSDTVQWYRSAETVYTDTIRHQLRAQTVTLNQRVGVRVPGSAPLEGWL